MNEKDIEEWQKSALEEEITLRLMDDNFNYIEKWIFDLSEDY